MKLLAVKDQGNPGMRRAAESLVERNPRLTSSAAVPFCKPGAGGNVERAHQFRAVVADPTAQP
jgi:hypothetical protein